MNYYQISAADLGKEAKIPILKLGDSAEVFYELAMIMIREIRKNNEAGRQTVFICPVGPVGQYPIFVRLVNQEKVSLKNVWFFNMDEYLQENGEWIDSEHILSFRGFMARQVYDRIAPELVMPREQRVFPQPDQPEKTDERLKALGGADICIGGIGINGHLAFNEASETLTVEEFAKLPTRVLTISPETRAINGAGSLGGAIDAMPKNCVTLGMKEILSAKRIVLAVFRDWHRAVIRQAAYGEVTAHFPASLVQRHPNALILTNENAAGPAF
jgi:hypothetical protein